MARLAVIGGTGLDALSGLTPSGCERLLTPYGNPSAAVTLGSLSGVEVLFLPRHGPEHSVAPHRINYRANIWVLHRLGARRVIGVNAVGAISRDLDPGEIVIPNQIVDYTWGRGHTYHEGDLRAQSHIDFTYPYCESLRATLCRHARALGVCTFDSATYAVTQGPRLETAAEIDRLERDGCHIVGMTGMPEAALARELGVDYAACAVVANMAAGRGAGVISMQTIEKNLRTGMQAVHRLLESVIVEI